MIINKQNNVLIIYLFMIQPNPVTGTTAPGMSTDETDTYFY